MLTSAVADEPNGGKRYLIIHTDDAGMSHSVNQRDDQRDGEWNCLLGEHHGPLPWLPEFAAYARQNPDKDYGIHLTVNSEFKNYRWRPVSPQDKVPSLLDEDGYMYRGVRSSRRQCPRG